MSPAAYGNTNRATHRAVVDLVGLYLDGAGIVTTRKRTPTSLSDSFTDDVVLAPDLAVHGVHLNVSSKLTHKLWEDLESVQRGAAINHTPVGAFVQWRGEQEIADAYVVTSLADFAKLIRGDHLTPPT